MKQKQKNKQTCSRTDTTRMYNLTWMLTYELKYITMMGQRIDTLVANGLAHASTHGTATARLTNTQAQH